ncbi:hypothetical protein ABZ912_38310 [Nonomuraea angiospora]|uniref:tyrosine-type recombinase/integrase n=1 Tax=Nonomuraea angiospora TaxID=46172 RepID=UPI0033E289A4
MTSSAAGSTIAGTRRKEHTGTGAAALLLSAASIAARRLSARSIDTIVGEIGRLHDAQTSDPVRELGALRPHDARHTFAFQLSQASGHCGCCWSPCPRRGRHLRPPARLREMADAVREPGDIEGQMRRAATQAIVRHAFQQTVGEQEDEQRRRLRAHPARLPRRRDRLRRHHGEEIAALTATPIRAYLADLSPSGRKRKRKRAAVASFGKWAARHDLPQANPRDRIDTVKVPKTLPRPAAVADVAKVPAVICSRRSRKDLPLNRLRGRVLFETAYVCGPRASEVCGLYVEDLDLRLDDEHVGVHGKGGSVLLDARGYVALLKLYLARAGYTSGPLSRAGINGRGGPLSYDAAHTAGRPAAPPHASRSTCTSCATPRSEKSR